MSVEKKIEHTLSDNFNLIHLEVINESHMHSGPNTESHFKVILVSDEFEDVKLVQRHRRINELLKFELENDKFLMKNTPIDTNKKEGFKTDFYLFKFLTNFYILNTAKKKKKNEQRKF